MAKGVLGNAFLVGALTALSRVLGLVREMLQSRLIGAGVEQSAFTLAFALPNMMRKLFGEGALTAAFVPVFRGEVEAVGVERAGRLARAVMTTVFAALAALTALAFTALEGLTINKSLEIDDSLIAISNWSVLNSDQSGVLLLNFL